MEKSDNYCDKTIKKIEQIIADKFSKLKLITKETKEIKACLYGMRTNKTK